MGERISQQYGGAWLNGKSNGGTLGKWPLLALRSGFGGEGRRNLCRRFARPYSQGAGFFIDYQRFKSPQKNIFTFLENNLEKVLTNQNERLSLYYQTAKQ